MDLFDDHFEVRGLFLSLSDGDQLPRHEHPWAQLVYARSGVMQVNADGTEWLVPPTRAIWIPAGIPHELRMRGKVEMSTLYADTRYRDWPRHCFAMEVTPLLRELVLHMVESEGLRAGAPGDEHRIGLLCELIRDGRNVPIALPMPDDPRARKLAERLLSFPGCTDSLGMLARHVGGSLRTLQRIFSRETGLSLEAWRLRARMQQAVVMMSEGRSVSETALECGYRSSSAFSHAFRQLLGEPPSSFLG